MTKVTFIEQDGNELEIDSPNGLSLMEIARKNGVAIEGACGGCLSCSTCHVIVDPEWMESIGKKTEKEEDILDLVFGLKKTSRLGCQILMSDKLDGLRVALPGAPLPWEK